MFELDRSTWRHFRRIAVVLVVLAPVAYFAPIPIAVWIACGVLDVSRHRNITLQLIEEYFTGKGLFTWALSPFNLLADLLARRPRRPERVEDLPDDCRQEIAACVAAFRENRGPITDAIRPHLAEQKRVMLAFKWFGAQLASPVGVAAFERDFRYVKTIAVSTFNGRERTSWHFGPQRLTLRVLQNLEPIDDPGVYLAVDDRVHRWSAEPLVVFDDTLFHQSVNDSSAVRHCLFIDIIRPNHFRAGFEAAVEVMGLTASSFRSIFYRNWSFLRPGGQRPTPQPLA
jgi:beta-hydroxylase